jgi:epoxyqueuosine reductase
MEREALTCEVKRRASELGFSLCGVCPAVVPTGAARLEEWLAAGYAGQMHYLADRREAYGDPNRVLDGVRSIVMLAMNYRTADPKAPREGEGRVSRYAWSATDYHDYIRERLDALVEFLRDREPAAAARGVVDTAPLLEREFAELAGLGWVGKNTLLINRQEGSWFFLAAVLTDLELAYDTWRETDHCGTCRACLDACPTGAFPQAYVLDASRCISYLTIELREAVPHDLRPAVGEWLFGCDVCQEVCPWNSRVPLSRHAEFGPREGSDPLDAIALLDLDDAAFRERFRHTALWRARRRGLLRNAAIVLGNRPTAAAIPALIRGLNGDEPLVRGACAWALGRHATPTVSTALQARRAMEADAEVRGEIEAALGDAIDLVAPRETESTS